MAPPDRKHVALVVLGDLGRSPRMQYHALALADAAVDVDLIGYAGTPVYRSVRENPKIICHHLGSPGISSRHKLPRMMFIFYSAWRLFNQMIQLLWILVLGLRKPDILILQNPPAIPTLLVAVVVARLRFAKIVVDWHNFGYAMLALKLGFNHWIVRLACWYEKLLGSRADGHFCVSSAMQKELESKWGIKAIVLLDRPGEQFEPTALEIRRALFRRLHDSRALDTVPYDPDGPARPAIIVSPTSWTLDEDYGLLLEAAGCCEEMIRTRREGGLDPPFPRVLILITGEGPLRHEYEQRMSRLSLRYIQLKTLWLSAEDYPLLLGASDLGLCLHRSASGVDLPMKVADMFGSGLPVLALNYGPCLAEQIRHGEDGLLFNSSEELARQIFDLLKGFPDELSLLDRMRQNVAKRHHVRWSDEWREKALPIFRTL